MKDDENRMKFLCDPEQHKLTLALHRQENLRANRAEVELAEVTAERDALLAAQMTEEKARQVLGGWIVGGKDILVIEGTRADGTVCLDGHAVYSADELKAIAWWMENKGDGR